MTTIRSGGLRAVAIIAALLLAPVWPAGRLLAQDSQFGISGLGTPGKWESVRARSAGGAFAPFDAFSPFTDAALADVRNIAAGITSGSSWRTVDAGGTTSTLRGTRFPALVIAGPIAGRLVLGGGFSTYLDRTYGIITHDTLNLRGVPEPITDQITSDGGVTDLRLAAAIRVHHLAVGAGLHLLTGSSRIIATRTFTDTAHYRTSSSRDELAYDGAGGSVSALFDLTPVLRLGGWFRTDSRLEAKLGGRTTSENNLPVLYGSGVEWRPGSQVTLAGTVQWRNWASAGAGPNAHDTFDWSAGAELGSAHSPIRLGARHSQLPFGVGRTPTETGLSVGLGRQFSAGRGRLDFGLERLQRSGDGLSERVWTLLLGLTVRP